MSRWIEVTIKGRYCIDDHAGYDPHPDGPQTPAEIDAWNYESNQVALAEVIDWLDEEGLVVEFVDATDPVGEGETQ